MKNAVSVDVKSAKGKARNFIYAMFICNGYNPCDSVFWGMLKSNPPSDKSWNYICDIIIKDLGESVIIPQEWSI